MRIRKSGRNTHVRFDEPWESKVWLARQNAAWFDEKTAKKLYREAIKMAPEEMRDEIREMMKRDCGVSR